MGFEKRANRGVVVGGRESKVKGILLDSDLRDLAMRKDGERLLEGESVRSSREEVEAEKRRRLKG